MLELVFVVVVIGILAAVAIPRLERDNSAEAAYQIARHIRLAQHHALVDDKYENGNPDWKGKMWAITFRTSKYCYAVYTNLDYPTGTQADENESAIDPLTKKRLYSDTNCNESNARTDDVLLWKSFGVNNIAMSTGCGPNNQILFDNLGRPYGSVGNLLNDNCVITIQTDNGHSAEITVYKDTGFVKVTKIDASTLP